MDHEHSEPDGQWGQHRHVRVTCAAFGVGGGEHGVDEDEGADDFCSEGGALVVPGGDRVSPAALGVEVVLHEGLH